MRSIEIEGVATVSCADDDTILRSSLRSGIGFPYGCNVGSCGNCRFQLLQGTVEHLRDDPPAWSDRDRERGRWLGCQARPLSDCRIKVRPDPERVPPHPPARMRARLARAVRITHDITEFSLELAGPDHFEPGQYALVYLPDVVGARAYSMCNLPGEGVWRFLIKRTPGGAATTALFDRLRTGDAVGVDGPFGAAYLRPERPGHLLLVAGGSGLSPMVSIARAASADPGVAEREIRFFYGGRAPRDMCCDLVLAGVPGFGERVVAVEAASEPPPGWTGPSGFVHDVVRDSVGDRLPEFRAYFAGPPPMVQAMQQMLYEAGVPPDRMHYDEFF